MNKAEVLKALEEKEEQLEEILSSLTLEELNHTSKKLINLYSKMILHIELRKKELNRRYHPPR